MKMGMNLKTWILTNTQNPNSVLKANLDSELKKNFVWKNSLELPKLEPVVMTRRQNYSQESFKNCKFLTDWTRKTLCVRN